MTLFDGHVRPFKQIFVRISLLSLFGESSYQSVDSDSTIQFMFIYYELWS